MKDIKYRILAYYTTGDSLTSEQTTDEIIESSDIDIVCENMDRLKEHYLWYTSKSRYPYKEREKPSFVVGNEEYYTGGRIIKLKADNGNDLQLSLPYCGVFEYLHKLYVETSLEIDFTKIKLGEHE